MQRAATNTVETTFIPVSELADLHQTVARLERENRLLTEKLHHLLHQRFGRSSERSDASQGTLFETAAAAAAAAAAADADAETVVVEAHQRKKGGRSPAGPVAARQVRSRREHGCEGLAPASGAPDGPEWADSTDRPDWTGPLFRHTSKVRRQVLRFFKHGFHKIALQAL